MIPKSVYDTNRDIFDECVNILQCNSNSIKKLDARKFLNDNSIDLSVQYDCRSRDYIKSQIDSVGYRLLDYIYDFDEQPLSGAGLGYDVDIDNFL